MLVWCSRAAAFASRRNRSRARRSPATWPGQDLERHPAAQADLLGLVDDPHAAPADLAEDPVVAQPPFGDRHGRNDPGAGFDIFGPGSHASRTDRTRARLGGKASP